MARVISLCFSISFSFQISTSAQPHHPCAHPMQTTCVVTRLDHTVVYARVDTVELVVLLVLVVM